MVCVFTGWATVNRQLARSCWEADWSLSPASLGLAGAMWRRCRIGRITRLSAVQVRSVAHVCGARTILCFNWQRWLNRMGAVYGYHAWVPYMETSATIYVTNNSSTSKSFEKFNSVIERVKYNHKPLLYLLNHKGRRLKLPNHMWSLQRLLYFMVGVTG